MTTTTVTLPAAALAGIAQLVHFNPASKTARDHTPILAAIEVTLQTQPGNGTSKDRVTLTALATDRYMVGRYSTEIPAADVGFDTAMIADGPGFPFLLSYDLLKSLKVTTKDRADWNITIETPERNTTAQYEDSTVTVSNGVRSQTAHVAGGNYPAVGRLIPAEAALAPLQSAYALRPAHIARIAEVANPVTLKVDDAAPWRLDGTHTDNPTRSTPVVWTSTFSTVHRFTVLQQPNILTR